MLFPGGNVSLLTSAPTRMRCFLPGGEETLH
jgi:hypothetical protein